MGKPQTAKLTQCEKLQDFVKLAEFHKHKSLFNEGVSAVALTHIAPVRTMEHTRVTLRTLRS